jgi:hypothetical protein
MLDHAPPRHTLPLPQRLASMPGRCMPSMPNWNRAWNGLTILLFSVATRGRPYCRRSVSSPRSERTPTDHRLSHSGPSASQASSASPNAHATGVSLAIKKLSWRRTNPFPLPPLSSMTFMYMLYHTTSSFYYPILLCFFIGHYTPGDWLSGLCLRLRPDRRFIALRSSTRLGLISLSSRRIPLGRLRSRSLGRPKIAVQHHHSIHHT